MFAGEGPPERTNRRFHYLSLGQPAARLSTAFDSVTLYGEDPAERPDIYGKVGNSGVSIATLDDMKALYAGFDLCDPTTSVSMTINGPAPMILAFFMNAAIDQQVERHLRETGEWEGWLLYLLRGIAVTARHTTGLVEAIGQLLQQHKHVIRERYRFYSQDLINNIFRHPYTKVAFVEQDLGVSRATAARYLDALAEGGILDKYRLGRENYYVNRELVRLLFELPPMDTEPTDTEQGQKTR
jgi:methylmalonyl-CoA mutase N-terminal domain/subunit